MIVLIRFFKLSSEAASLISQEILCYDKERIAG